MEDVMQGPAPATPPQVLLTLMPDGNVAVRVQGTTDRALISRMLAAAILTANQPEAEPKPRLVLPGVRFNGVRG